MPMTVTTWNLIFIFIRFGKFNRRHASSPSNEALCGFSFLSFSAGKEGERKDSSRVIPSFLFSKIKCLPPSLPSFSVERKKKKIEEETGGTLYLRWRDLDAGSDNKNENEIYFYYQRPTTASRPTKGIVDVRCGTRNARTPLIRLVPTLSAAILLEREKNPTLEEEIVDMTLAAWVSFSFSYEKKRERERNFGRLT